MDLMDIMAACDSRVNMISSTLHTNTKTVRGRPTLKDVKRLRNGLNLMRERELYEGTFHMTRHMSEPSNREQ